MYPYGIDGTKTHELRQEVPPGDFQPQNISNGLVAFADGGEGRSYNNKCAIACVIIFIFGVAFR